MDPADNLTATYTVVFELAACVPATPQAPIVASATCTAGVVLNHVITTPETAGTTYTLEPPGDPAGEFPGTQSRNVAVTAPLPTAMAWLDTMPDGWVVFTPTIARFT